MCPPRPGLSPRLELECRDESSVRLSCTLGPVAGYPFTLRLTASHALSADGLHSRITAVNTGTDTAPYGVCPHPYLLAGPAPLDEWTLQIPADTFLEVTPDRLLPLAARSVAGHEFDFRAPRRIGATEIDHAFTGIAFDGDGGADGDGRVVAPRTPCGPGPGGNGGWHGLGRVQPVASGAYRRQAPAGCPTGWASRWNR